MRNSVRAGNIDTCNRTTSIYSIAGHLTDYEHLDASQYDATRCHSFNHFPLEGDSYTTHSSNSSLRLCEWLWLPIISAFAHYRREQRNLMLAKV